MPRDGGLARDRLRTVGRPWRYSVASLMELHRNAKLTDLLQTLADCQKARSASIHDRCKAVYEGL